MQLDETHDPNIHSWVESSQIADCDFPLQNLPLGIFRERVGAPGGQRAFRAGVAIGQDILDLSHPAAAALLEPQLAVACRAGALNDLMALGAPAAASLRRTLWQALRAGHARAGRLQAALVAQAGAEMALPARIGDFTDFYASIHHASAVGALLRPEAPLFPNYKWMPVAYHGRASSIQVSGQPVSRPRAQVRASGATEPIVAATRRLDFELELGFLIGMGNPPGQPIAMADAWEHVFGVVLLNDWSARDIQAWEYQPLGPFLSKNFATRISPWVVTAQALLPFRCAATRPPQDPAPLPYLRDREDAAAGALDIHLEAWIRSASMRSQALAASRLACSNARHAYWTVAQMLAHHTVNGCNLRPGDLLGSGTLSGPAAGQAACLLELTRGGLQPVALPDGQSRAFLEDGDEIELRAWCRRDGFARIGLGSVAGRVQGNPIED